MIFPYSRDYGQLCHRDFILNQLVFPRVGVVTATDKPFPHRQERDEDLLDADDHRGSSVEPELLQIFTEEANQYLDQLDELCAVCITEQSGLVINEELLRILHTLKGGARTVCLPQVADLFESLERHAKKKKNTTAEIPNDVLVLYMEVTKTVREILSNVNDPNGLTANCQILEKKLGRLLDDDDISEGRVESLDIDPQSTPMVVEKKNDKKHITHSAKESDMPESSLAGTEALTADLPGQQDAELVEVYFEESNELLDAIDNSLDAWSHAPVNKPLMNEVQRQLHTLKGGARMSGFSNIGNLSHAIESLIVSTISTQIDCDARLFEALYRALDRLHQMQSEAQNGQPVYPASDVISMLEGIRKGEDNRISEVHGYLNEKSRLAQGAAASSVEEIAKSEARQSCQQAIDTRTSQQDGFKLGDRNPEIRTPNANPHQKNRLLEASGSKNNPHGAQGGGHASQDLVRVRSELMDRLVNDAGEVNIYHDRLGQQISAFGYNLKELDQTVLRLRQQLRKLELETEAQILFRYDKDVIQKDKDFDPLELDRYSTIQQLSRALSESVGDLVSIQEILTNLMRDAETLLLQQSRVSTELQESLMRTRMLRFSILAPRLRRIARQTANELNKKVKLVVDGESNEIDRTVLDRIVAPLEHMLRNAISHGIESTEKRQRNNKSAVGEIRINVSREASEVIIRVEDDGAGIDLERVREKARLRGFIKEGDELSDHEVMQFILESGFSTAKEVTQISGRGVGMDVVNNEIKELGGVLSIHSALGKGSVFEVRLPFTMAINKALLVQSGEDLFAIPLTSIEGIIRLTAEELRQRYAHTNPIYEFADNEYELKHLGTMLRMSQPMFTDAHSLFPVLLVRSGVLRVALQAEGLLGSREIVVKSVGAQLGKLRGVSGATILGDGRVILILDVPGLIRLGAGTHTAVSTSVSSPQSELPSAVKVMVVDDSITIRKVTSRMLERNRFEVMTAKDGIDAIGQLQEQIPHLVLLDIEMPRMDGFELATHIRNNERLKQVPIIMITSRTGKKHRRRAMDMGVNKYLGKPYKESELLDSIREVLALRYDRPRIIGSLKEQVDGRT